MWITPTAKWHVKEIADWFRGSGIPLNSVHSPLYADYEWGRAGAPPVNVTSTDRATRVEAMDEIKRALEIAEQIPFRFLVQHLGTPNESFSEKKFEAAMTSIEHLRKPLPNRSGSAFCWRIFPMNYRHPTGWWN